MKNRSLFFFPLLLIILVACAGESKTPAPAGQSTPVVLTITSQVFREGSPIPTRYTCVGEDLSPALEFGQPPSGTKSLALLMDDPDAPGGTWTHWILYNLPVDTASLEEGASKAKGQTFQLPSGAEQGKTSFGRADYGGPCPPSGTHHYNFRLYALDTTLPSGAALDRSAFLNAIDGHILGQGTLIGTFSK